MKSNDSKCYLGYLNKLADEYNNSYHCSFGKKPIDADYPGLSEDFKSSLKAPKFKVDARARNTKYMNIFSKS